MRVILVASDTSAKTCDSSLECPDAPASISAEQLKCAATILIQQWFRTWIKGAHQRAATLFQKRWRAFACRRNAVKTIQRAIRAFIRRRRAFRMVFRRRKACAIILRFWKTYRKEDRCCPVCLMDDEEGFIRLGCKHWIHKECLLAMAKAGWPGPQISFNFISCATCRAPLKLSVPDADVAKALKPHLKLKRDLLVLAKARGKDNLDEFNSFICCKCNQPFIHDRAACEDMQDIDGSAMVCPHCEYNDLKSPYLCPIHSKADKETIMRKCDWCCGIAKYQCGNMGFFCEICHSSGMDGYCKFIVHCSRRVKYPQSIIETRSNFCCGFVCIQTRGLCMIQEMEANEP